MRSNLTRSVLKNIVYKTLHPEVPSWHQPVSQYCLYQRKSRRNVRLPIVPRRSLFGFTRSKPAKTSNNAADSAYELLAQLDSQLSQGIRPAPPRDVAQALNTFLEERERLSIPVEDVQVLQAQPAFEYLRRTQNDVDCSGLSSNDIRTALRALALEPKDGRSGARLQLATQLYKELEHKASTIPRSEGLDNVVAQETDFVKGVEAYISILSRTGQTREARDVVESYWSEWLKEYGHGPWTAVLRGFVKEADADELSKTVKLMAAYDVPFSREPHGAVVISYAKLGDLEAAKKWYDRPVAGSGTPKTAANAAILELCIHKHEYEWGEKVFRSCLDKSDPKRRIWALVLKWSAAKGKGVDEIERMMNVMIQRNEGLSQNRKVFPDAGMINELVDLANSRNEPYTAERYVALGQKWGIQPDARTYLLQLDYRLNVGDLDGARAAYSKLQSEETSEDQDLPFVNKLVVALCEKDKPYDQIISIVEELTERKARFEPATVAALARLHFRRSEIDQVDGLLSSHIRTYSFEQRAFIRDFLVSFILDRTYHTALTWEIYRILRSHFPEISTELRTTLMTEFYTRRRPDMGVHVFGHMRQSPRRGQRPTAMTYKACFEGIARAGGDAESLQLVYNMLKIDTEVDPSTRLNNGLMLAYTASGSPERALEFWNDIVHSAEGPTYSSIQIALQACETATFGERTARDIWARLRRFGIKVTREIYAAYVGALAGQAKFQECVDLVDKMKEETGEKPDTLL